jgi:hypothetical protein
MCVYITYCLFTQVLRVNIIKLALEASPLIMPLQIIKTAINNNETIIKPVLKSNPSSVCDAIENPNVGWREKTKTI